MLSAATLATVFEVINEVLALLPVLIAAGANLAGLVQKIEAVWASAAVDANDPRFAETAQAASDARAKLQARLDVMKAAVAAAVPAPAV